MTLIIRNGCRFLLIMAWIASLSLSADASSETLDASDYWNYDLRGLLREVSEADGRICGSYQTRHGWKGFCIEKKRLANEKEKQVGYVSALGDFVSLVTYASGDRAAASAQSFLHQLTGLDLFREEWENWFLTNRDRLMWDDGKQQFVIRPTAKE